MSLCILNNNNRLAISDIQWSSMEIIRTIYCSTSNYKKKKAQCVKNNTQTFDIIQCFVIDIIFVVIIISLKDSQTFLYYFVFPKDLFRLIDFCLKVQEKIWIIIIYSYDTCIEMKIVRIHVFQLDL